MANTSNYALRLLASLKAEAEKVAAEEGTTLNQFINVAVAEKLAALRTTRYFRERVARADLEAFDRLLASAREEPPCPGDEVVELPQ
jgi:Zn-dependent oligopeptidase